MTICHAAVVRNLRSISIDGGRSWTKLGRRVAPWRRIAVALKPWRAGPAWRQQGAIARIITTAPVRPGSTRARGSGALSTRVAARQWTGPAGAGSAPRQRPPWLCPQRRPAAIAPGASGRSWQGPSTRYGPCEYARGLGRHQAVVAVPDAARPHEAVAHLRPVERQGLHGLDAPCDPLKRPRLHVEAPRLIAV